MLPALTATVKEVRVAWCSGKEFVFGNSTRFPLELAITAAARGKRAPTTGVPMKPNENIIDSFILLLLTGTAEKLQLATAFSKGSILRLTLTSGSLGWPKLTLIHRLLRLLLYYFACVLCESRVYVNLCAVFSVLASLSVSAQTNRNRMGISDDMGLDF